MEIRTQVFTRHVVRLKNRDLVVERPHPRDPRIRSGECPAPADRNQQYAPAGRDALETSAVSLVDPMITKARGRVARLRPYESRA